MPVKLTKLMNWLIEENVGLTGVEFCSINAAALSQSFISLPGLAVVIDTRYNPVGNKVFIVSPFFTIFHSH